MRVDMSKKEVSRADIFSQIDQRKIKQVKAAEILGISTRHLQRLYREYRQKGVVSLISKSRGKASNHKLPNLLIARVKELIICFHTSRKR